jgi:uncharacterized protein (TIGR00369 family)
MSDETLLALRTRPGLDLLRALVAGELPPPGAAILLGIHMVAADPGTVTMSLVPHPSHANPMGTMHGGILATLLDSVMGCAIHTTLPAGRGYTTLEIKVNYLRAVTAASGEITAIGQVVQSGRRTAVAEARVTDAAGKLCATASTTCLVFDLAEPMP